MGTLIIPSLKKELSNCGVSISDDSTFPVTVSAEGNDYTIDSTGTVYLGQAQGYNNGVKLLNDACSSLYSNASKGITARSLNIDDIEKYMNETKLSEVHEYKNISSGVNYGKQVSVTLHLYNFNWLQFWNTQY